MKKAAIIVLFICLVSSASPGRDFMVEVVHENYRQEGEQVYHSLEVDSLAGNKILVLQGDNDQYRKWLREYMASEKTFIASVPDEDNFSFISSKVYNIDIGSVHPVREERLELSPAAGGAAAAVMNEKRIMIVDGNTERRQLVRQLVQQLGYDPRVFSDGNRAYDFFRLQPGLFEMVITSNEIRGLKVDRLVEKCINLSPGLPVMVGTGYDREEVKEGLLRHFSGMENVYVKPLILDNLTQSIVNILQKKKA